MARFDYWKQFVKNQTLKNAERLRHIFYDLSKNDIEAAEKRLGMVFPKELREFYSDVGYGFLCNDNDYTVDRIMDPDSVADFRLKEGMYESDSSVDLFSSESKLVFFEVSKVSYIHLDLKQMNINGICPVYYFDSKIADSLLEFLEAMNRKTDYYLDK